MINIRNLLQIFILIYKNVFKLPKNSTPDNISKYVSTKTTNFLHMIICNEIKKFGINS